MTDMCEQRLFSAPSVKSNDPEGLKNYSEALEKALITLQTLSSFASVNWLDSMTKLINKLPFELRRRWVKESVTLEERHGRTGQFADFVLFVARESEEMNSLFGRRVFGSKSGSKNSRDLKKVAKSTSSFVVGNRSSSDNVSIQLTTNSWWYGNDSAHKLHGCPKFLALDISDRSKFVKTKRLCYKCLSSRHKTNECQRTNCCLKKGCKGTYHYTLLHNPNFKPKSNMPESSEVDPPANEKSSSDTSAVTCAQISSGVYLCVVPVCVKYGEHEAMTHAFLDQWSSQSLCDQKLIKAF